MYSLACIVNAVSLTYYAFTLSKVIVMRITLQYSRPFFVRPHYTVDPAPCGHTRSHKANTSTVGHSLYGHAIQ